MSLVKSTNVSMSYAASKIYDYDEKCFVNKLSTTSQQACQAAYSTRLVDVDYTGPTVNVRRGSDNATQDFYADANGILGTSLNGKGMALFNWLSGGTGYIVTWYDQSGWARHLTQSTTTSQPTIGVAEYPPAGMNASTTTFNQVSYGIGSYVASASTTVSGWDAYKAFDNNNGDEQSCWASGGAYNTITGAYTGSVSTTISGSAYTGEWLQIQLQNSIKLSSYSIKCRDNTESAAPNTWKLAGSNDNSTWTIIDTQTNISNWSSTYRTQTFTVGSTTSYTYYRIVCNVNGQGGDYVYKQYFMIDQFKLFATTEGSGNVLFNGKSTIMQNSYNGTRAYPPSAMTTNSTSITGASYDNGTYIASASSELAGGYESYKAFDNNTATFWHTREVTYDTPTGIYNGAGFSTTANNKIYEGEWLQLKTPNAITLNNFTILPRAGYETIRAPRSFVILGSNDGSTWSLIHEEGNVNTWVASTSKTFYVKTAPNQSYSYYRIVIRRVGNADSGSIYQNSAQIATWTLNTASVPLPPGSKKYTYVLDYTINDLSKLFIPITQEAFSPADNTSGGIYSDGIGPLFFSHNNDARLINANSNVRKKNILLCNHNLSTLNINFCDNGTFYKNTTPAPSSINLSNDVFTIGGRQSSSAFFYSGYINEVIVFNTTLSDNEALAYYQTTNIKSLSNYLTKPKIQIRGICKDNKRVPSYFINKLAIDLGMLENTANASALSKWGSYVATSAVRPTYYSIGGYVGNPYVNFNATSSQHMDSGSVALNVNSGGGFTAVAFVKFGTYTTSARIFDFGNGEADNNILVYRSGSTNITFLIFNGATSYGVTAANAVTEGDWATFVFRYNPSLPNRYFNISKNGKSLNTAVYSALSGLSISDRTVTKSYIGRSNWSGDGYTNMDLGGLYVYPVFLNDSEVSTITNHLVHTPNKNALNILPDYQQVNNVGQVVSNGARQEFSMLFPNDVNSYYDIQNVPDFPITFGAWIFPIATQYQEVIGLCDKDRGGTSGIGIQLYPTGYIHVDVNSAEVVVADNTVAYSINTWYHVAVSINSSNVIKLYWNGSLVATKTATSPITKKSRIILGAPGSNWPYAFSGYVHDFRLYDYVLRANEIRAIANEEDSPNISDFKEPNNYIVNRRNWYSTMNLTQSQGTFTAVTAEIDPIVQYQLLSSSVLNSHNHLSNNKRIQDYKSFTCSFQVLMNTVGADAMYFFCGSTALPSSELATSNGVHIVFEGWSGNSSIPRGVSLIKNSTNLAADRKDFLTNGLWHKVTITYTRGAINTWVVNMYGQDIITYSDSSNESWINSSGSYWGIAARSGGSSMNAYVRQVELSFVPYTNSIVSLMPSSTLKSYPQGNYLGVNTSGLIAYFDPGNPGCYSAGSGRRSLVGDATGTLTGTYALSNGAMRLTNTSTSWTSNTSMLQLSSITNLTTVSVWYYQHSNNSDFRLLLDARVGISVSEMVNTSIGSAWTNGTFYKNGGSALSVTWANIETVGVWQNLTFITSTPGTDDLTLFGHYTTLRGGLDVTFGPILIYNRAITQAENLANYNAIVGNIGSPIGASASSFQSGWEPRFAFDQSAGNWTHSTAVYNQTTGAYTGGLSTTVSGSAYSGEWLQNQLPNAIKLQSYSITGRTVQSDVPQNPTSWVIAGSNDGSSWSLVDARSGITWSTIDRDQTFDVNSNVSYKYFRIIVRAMGINASYGYAVISKLRLNSYSDSPDITTGTKYPIAPLNQMYPPAAMTTASTTLSTQNYGNGLYVASASTQHASGNFQPYKAFDHFADFYHSDNSSGLYNTTNGTYGGSVSTMISGSGYAGEWLQIQLPNAIALQSYTLTARTGSFDQLPNSWRLAGSNDGSNWTLVDTRSSQTFNNNGPFSFTVNSNIEYIYYRIVCTIAGLTAGAFVVGELRFFAITNIVGSGQGCGKYLASASSEYTTGVYWESADKAFNMDTTEFWTNNFQNYTSTTGVYNGASTTTVDGVSYPGEWLQIQLPNAISLSSYSMLGRAETLLRSPRDFIVAGSNDGSTWKLVDQESNVIGWTTAAMSFGVSTIGKYSYYRLITTKNNGDTRLTIAEWCLYDKSASVSSIAGKARGLVEGLTWKFADGYLGDTTTTYFDTNGYTQIGRSSDFTDLTRITTGRFTTAQAMDGYSIQFDGYFRASETGTYRFNTNSDDYAYLWIGKSALSGYTTGNATVSGSSFSSPKSGSVNLLAGVYYPIKISYGENSGGQLLSVSFVTPSGATITNGYGYYFSSIGTNSAYPAESARVIKDITGTNLDGVYYINVNGISSPTYCLMNDKYDGGGWMMMMKATQGTTFQYTANYWTTANTLNETDLTRNDGDAKYNVFNYNKVKDVMAIWPDVASGSYTNVYGQYGGSLNLDDGWCWMLNNWNGASKSTALAGFQSSRDANPNNPFTSNGYSSSVFSNQTGSYRYVLGGGTHLNGADAFVRWGYIFNNQSPDAFGTTDVVCGIGIPASTVGGSANYSAGDCPNIGSGGGKTVALNRSMRVELFGR